MCNIAKVCSLCNESGVEYDDVKMKYRAIGEPTEAALQVLVEKMGLPASADVVNENEKSDSQDNHSISVQRKNPSTRCNIVNRFWRSKYEVRATMEFSRTRKSMSVICAPKVN